MDLSKHERDLANSGRWRELHARLTVAIGGVHPYRDEKALAPTAHAYGVACMMLARFDEAERWLGQAASAYEAAGRRSDAGASLVELSGVKRLRGDCDAALVLLNTTGARRSGGLPLRMDGGRRDSAEARWRLRAPSQGGR
jgi:hypothetical protein